MNKIKIYDFRVYLNLNSEEFESDIMCTDLSKNKKIQEKTKELFDLICNKASYELGK